MLQPFTLFTGTTGLNTRNDPARLIVGKNGMCELAAAVNVNVERTGRLSRRKGYDQKVDTSDCHSAFSAGAYGLFVTGTDLKALNPDYSVVTVATVTEGQWVSYVRIANRVYWANGFEKGYVIDQVNYDWAADDYIGPATVKTFSDPPVGTHLCLYNGRMYIAVEDVLWHSEPFAYSWVDMSKNYEPMGNTINMVEALSDGRWVGTDTGIYYLGGPTPDETVLKRVSGARAVTGTVVEVDGWRIGKGEIPGKVLLMTTTEGVCLAGPDGLFINLTEKKLNMPSFNRGSAAIIDGRYVCCLE